MVNKKYKYTIKENTNLSQHQEKNILLYSYYKYHMDTIINILLVERIIYTILRKKNQRLRFTFIILFNALFLNTKKKNRNGKKRVYHIN